MKKTLQLKMCIYFIFVLLLLSQSKMHLIDEKLISQTTIDITVQINTFLITWSKLFY